jgi:hypothetical protein
MWAIPAKARTCGHVVCAGRLQFLEEKQYHIKHRYVNEGSKGSGGYLIYAEEDRVSRHLPGYGGAYPPSEAPPALVPQGVSHALCRALECLVPPDCPNLHPALWPRRRSLGSYSTPKSWTNMKHKAVEINARCLHLNHAITAHCLHSKHAIAEIRL